MNLRRLERTLSPGEGNFVGDPLARPFGSDVTWQDGVLTNRTSHMAWRVEPADGPEGSWEVARDGIEGGRD